MEHGHTLRSDGALMDNDGTHCVLCECWQCRDCEECLDHGGDCFLHLGQPLYGGKGVK